MSKTPQFDKALDEILTGLKPHQRTCRQCGGVFNVFQEDIEFYEKLRASPPTLCPDCRMQRRLGYRVNLLPIFYKKTCSAPGHNEKVIAFYSEQNPVKVYDDKFYLSDQWNPLSFGRDYDFSKPFFEQFNRLALQVPHQTLQKDPQSINCDYVVSGISSKNCYYVAVPYRSEDVYYSYLPLFSKDCLDVSAAGLSEQCYGSIIIDSCYNCHFCYESMNCLDSYFLYDCRNCSHCFGCTNLRHKKYYFFNEALAKQEYQKRIKGINLGRRSVLQEYQGKFEQLLQKAIRKNLTHIKAENFFGNDAKWCRDCFWCFSIWNSENLRYSASIDNCRDLMDFFGGSHNFFSYESTGVSSSNNIRFCAKVWNSLDSEYCGECSNCLFCFGCFGLRNKKYCILNKQYAEDEYWQLIDKIKTEMLKTGEYGEFFPLKFSPVAYQDSSSQIEFPLTEQEIKERGWHWEDKPEDKVDLSRFKKVLRANELPDDIADVADDILEAAIICEQTGKPFRITRFELDFYRKHNLPLPTIHPLQRIKNRYSYGSFWHFYKLWHNTCSKCRKKIFAGYAPEKKLKVYCEACYLKEVY